MKTSGHCILITGGATGIGLALAALFAPLLSRNGRDGREPGQKGEERPRGRLPVIEPMK